MSEAHDKYFIVLMLFVLLLVVWAMFLAMLYMMATIVIPMFSSSVEPLHLSIFRIAAGILIMLVWVVVWHRFAMFWLHKMLRGSKNGPGE